MLNETILSFEFAQSTGEIKPLTFKDPIKVIKANRVEDVIPSLKQVQQAVQDGYYAAGYIAYESAPAFDPKFKVVKDTKMPLLWFGIFSEAIEEMLQSDGDFEIGQWSPSTSKKEYSQAIEQIKSEIRKGNTNETNYTTRLHSQFRGDDLAFFTQLRRAQDSDYCAYLNIGEYRILSASPELFFHLKDDVILTKPMKGTVKRGRWFEEDYEKANWLYHSKKNRTENRITVDVLEDELGKIAERDSVQVTKMYEIESYPTVHQMTSTVQAKVKDNLDLVDIFHALFPGGSITGSPKVNTMKIISELETTPREVYCGAIGYVTPDNEAIFNVPIRTVTIDGNTGKSTYGAGSGVTLGSTAEGEYEEMLDKASLLKEERPDFELLESILLSNGKYFLLDEHMERLEKSARYFNFSLNKGKLKDSILNFAKDYPNGEYKVRILYSKKARLRIEADSIRKLEEPLKVKLARTPINKDNPFYYHKTTNRSIYSLVSNEQDVDEVLLWNEDEEITEFTNGNVVVDMDGLLWTPPVKSGLLAGTYREKLLNNKEIQEKVIHLDDLKRCDNIWFINSVRKWIAVEPVSLNHLVI